VVHGPGCNPINRKELSNECGVRNGFLTSPSANDAYWRMPSVPGPKSQLNWPDAEEFRLRAAELSRELAAASLTPRIKRYV
jgi:hypothetical protein